MSPTFCVRDSMSPSILTRIAASAPPAGTDVSMLVNITRLLAYSGTAPYGTRGRTLQKVVTADGLSVRDCALVEPMSVGFHAVSRAQVTDIDTVMVIGCGMIGREHIERIQNRIRGAQVVAVMRRI